MILTKNTTAEDIYFGCGFNHKEELAIVIFQALGWFHSRKWTQAENAIEETIKKLIEDCLERLIKEKNDTNCATGGLRVELMKDEDEITGELLIEL